MRIRRLVECFIVKVDLVEFKKNLGSDFVLFLRVVCSKSNLLH